MAYDQPMQPQGGQMMQPQQQQGGGMPMQPQQPPMMQQPQPQEEPAEMDMTAQLEAEVNAVNMAEDMEQEELDAIGATLGQKIKEDRLSMDPWLRRYEIYLKLAMQIKETKSFPWPNAANVKFPLLTTAAMQFHARAYPAVVNNKSLVKGKVIGYDPSGLKALRAERIGKHMTYQLLEKMDSWDESMDKLLFILPIAGCVFKKVHYDTIAERCVCDLVLPTDIIINYWASNLENARRITHRIEMYKNNLIEMQRLGFYLEVDLGDPKRQARTQEQDKLQMRDPVLSDEADNPYILLECHTFLDLDDDGYEEPYVVTIEEGTQKVLRIAPNYSLKDVKKTAKGKIAKITPAESFVKYDFIPAPDGGLLGVGFGLLLGGTNEVVNTTINQLLDQGSLKTAGGGFIAKGIRLKGGRMSFEPNEWKVVQSTGDDLRKGIVPLPVGEPSGVLFNLLQAMIQSGKEVISISEISTGKLPGQNTPATTTLSSIEEGMKLFNAIYKRVFRQLTKEFKLLFKLNKVYLKDEEYFAVLDSDGASAQTGQVTKADYNDEDMDVVPEADPTIASDALRLLKAQQLAELIPLGAVDPAVAGQRILMAMDQPNPQELMPKPQPDPKAQAEQMKMQGEQQKQQFEGQKTQMEAVIKMKEQEWKEREANLKSEMSMMKLKMQELEGMLNLRFKARSNQQDLEHKRALAQIRERKAQQKDEQGSTSRNKG